MENDTKRIDIEPPIMWETSTWDFDLGGNEFEVSLDFYNDLVNLIHTRSKIEKKLKEIYEK